MKKTYAHHKPDDSALKSINDLRQAFSDLDDLIRKLTPVTREQACAITNLETSAMWAIKALVVNDPKSSAVCTH